MKIRTKLIAVTISGAFLSTLVSVIIASVIINQQNQLQNKQRLFNANQSIEKSITDLIETLDTNFNEALRENSWGDFEILVDVAKPSTVMEFDTDLIQQIPKVGLLNNTDYAFYSTYGINKGSQIFSFNYPLKKILIAEGAIVRNEYDLIEIQEFHQKVEPFPELETIDDGFSLQSYNDIMYLMFKSLYVYQGTKRKSGLEAGTPTGYFVFKKKLPIDILEQGGFLGVNINIFDKEGKMLQGKILFSDLDSLDNEKSQTTTMVSPQNETYDSLISPILYQGKKVGYISMSISRSLINKKILESIQVLILSGVVVLILIALIAYFVIVTIIKPLAITATILNAIADEGGDLTQRMQEKGSEEVVDLAKAFNRFIIKIHLIIQRLQSSTDTLAISSEELASSSTEMEQAANQISKAINVENDEIQTGSLTIRDIVKSLTFIFNKIKNIQIEANTAKNIALESRNVIEDTHTKMMDIEENTKKIEGVVDVITTIANQTNLLSLNAAIEAAKAGDHGKGFAVVADEVRALAEKSAQQVVEIRHLVDLSQNSVKSGTSAIKKIEEVFVKIEEEADLVLNNVTDVADDISNQETSLNSVSQVMVEISKLSEENSASVDELSRTLTVTSTNTNKLSQLSEDISKSINEFKV